LERKYCFSALEKYTFLSFKHNIILLLLFTEFVIICNAGLKLLLLLFTIIIIIYKKLNTC